MSGVNIPTASVFLHFCHHDPYPILDFRELWSLGIDQRITYNFQIWWDYVKFCREERLHDGEHMKVGFMRKENKSIVSIHFDLKWESNNLYL